MTSFSASYFIAEHLVKKYMGNAAALTGVSIGTYLTWMNCGPVAISAAVARIDKTHLTAAQVEWMTEVRRKEWELLSEEAQAKVRALDSAARREEERERKRRIEKARQEKKKEKEEEHTDAGSSSADADLVAAATKEEIAAAREFSVFLEFEENECGSSWEKERAWCTSSNPAPELPDERRPAKMTPQEVADYAHKERVKSLPIFFGFSLYGGLCALFVRHRAATIFRKLYSIPVRVVTDAGGSAATSSKYLPLLNITKLQRQRPVTFCFNVGLHLTAETIALSSILFWPVFFIGSLVLLLYEQKQGKGVVGELKHQLKINYESFKKTPLSEMTMIAAATALMSLISIGCGFIMTMPFAGPFGVGGAFVARRKVLASVAL